jgi:hypothetical protein
LRLESSTSYVVHLTESIKLAEHGKKPTNVITIEVYEDNFKIEASAGIDMLDLYCIFTSALEYMHNYADYLETKESVTIQ